MIEFERKLHLKRDLKRTNLMAVYTQKNDEDLRMMIIHGSSCFKKNSLNFTFKHVTKTID